MVTLFWKVGGRKGVDGSWNTGRATGLANTAAMCGE